MKNKSQFNEDRFVQEIKDDFYEYIQITEHLFNDLSKVGVAGEEWNRYKLDNKNARDNHFFYISSPIYFMGIARLQFKRKGFRLDLYDKYAKGSVLDFGAGLGGEDFYLASKGSDVTYYEINSLCRDFMRFRSDKHDVSINILEPWQFNSHNKRFDTIFCFDVFDHVPNWRDMLPLFKQKLTTDGVLIHQTEFAYNTEECPYHFEDSLEALNQELERNNIKYISLVNQNRK